MSSCRRAPHGLRSLDTGCENREMWTGAFAKGTAQVEPGFLFVWGPASPCSAVTRRRKANKGIFRCFLLCFPVEGEAAAVGPLNLGLEKPGMRSWRGEGLCEMRSLKPR